MPSIYIIFLFCYPTWNIRLHANVILRIACDSMICAYEDMDNNYVTEKENKFRVFTVPEFEKFLDEENTLKYAVHLKKVIQIMR